jgi:hypothetical protein
MDFHLKWAGVQQAISVKGKVHAHYYIRLISPLKRIVKSIDQGEPGPSIG